MKKIAIVGAGFRCYKMFVENLTRDYSDTVEFVGVYDVNRVRSEFISKRAGKNCKIFDSFEKMLDTAKPDVVLVTAVDSVHHEYIVSALEKGFDVVSEKPITNTFERCSAIREAERKAGKNVTVTFNTRFMPYFSEMKSLIMQGRIGRPLAMNYEYYLDKMHGGDYFQRWHRFTEFSQGMLLHKSTHHFDAANWLIGDTPRFVAALGDRVYYGDEKKAYADCCRNCKRGDECETYKSVKEEYRYPDVKYFKEIYFDAEREDGYIRDRCAFAPDTDILDNMSVSVRYEHGALLTYSLNMFAWQEGAAITITGDEAMLTARWGLDGGDKEEIKILGRNGRTETVTIDKDKSTHGGGDARLLAGIFGDKKHDPLGRQANSYDGFTSAMIGIAANESIKSGKTIDLREYLAKLK